MSYLHSRSPPIAHRDLKSGNLLVDEDWHIKVSDFGLAQAKLTTHAHTQVGTFAWMAPEVLENQPYDERADVYSFAIVMWELAVKEEPFRGMHPMQIMRVIDKGDRPAVREDIDAHPDYVKLMQHCWEQKCVGRDSDERRLSACGFAVFRAWRMRCGSVVLTALNVFPASPFFAAAGLQTGRASRRCWRGL